MEDCTHEFFKDYSRAKKILKILALLLAAVYAFIVTYNQAFNKGRKYEFDRIMKILNTPEEPEQGPIS